MKTSKSSGINRPFKNLKTLLKESPVSLRSFPAERIFAKKKAVPVNEEILFEAAMSDVVPLDKKNVAQFDFEQKQPLPPAEEDANDETLVKLENLVKYGEGFVVENTPEYIEGAGPNVCREVLKKLHKGEYSIQDFIDLHGLNVPEAQEAFERFLKQSVASAKRGVLVVHGRGLKSPDEPVLKAKVCQWLTRGPWRKWVIAFSSARSCDGGAGATYVLLRRKPLTKSGRKKPGRKPGRKAP